VSVFYINIMSRFALIAITLIAAAAYAADVGETIPLPAARQSGGMPLFDALKNRKSTKEFSDKELDLKQISEILWCGFGVNRPKEMRRTAPSAMNAQEIDLYVSTKDGVYLYDFKNHALQKISNQDIRLKISGQPYSKDVPVVIVFVADYSRTKAAPAQRQLYAYIDTGFISQNIYLYCASEGLGTVIHELNRAETSKLLNLKSGQEVIMAQSVGYPKQ